MASKYRQIEIKYGKPMADILREMYERYGHEPNAQNLIAAELGCSQPSLSLWLKHLRLRRKTVLVEEGAT
jgi:hypothetical protein